MEAFAFAMKNITNIIKIDKYICIKNNNNNNNKTEQHFFKRT